VAPRIRSTPIAATPRPPAERTSGTLSRLDLAKRIWAAVNQHDLFGRSAQLAYYFFLALFPALIFLSALLGLLAAPGTRLYSGLLHYIKLAVPGPSGDLILRTLADATRGSQGGKITFGVIGTLWPMTSGMVAIQDTLNTVYEAKERRPFWKARLVGLGMTMVGSVLVIVTLAVILAGDVLAGAASAYLQLGGVTRWSWILLEWLIALLFLSLVFSTTYQVGPDLPQRRWQWVTPGALVGMTAWIVVSVGLRVYMHYFKSYTATYGSLGAVIVLLTWFYLSGLTFLLGAEVNVQVDKARLERRSRPSE